MGTAAFGKGRREPREGDSEEGLAGGGHYGSSIPAVGKPVACSGRWKYSNVETDIARGATSVRVRALGVLQLAMGSRAHP